MERGGALTLERISARTDTFLKEIHGLGREDSPDEGAEPSSVHYNEYDLSTWYGWKEVKMTKTTGNVMKFTLDPNYDFLSKSCIYAQFPHLKVREDCRDRYRIAWTHHAGHHLVESISAKILTQTIGYLDGVSLDIYFQFWREKGRRKLYLDTIGSVPAMENFASELPARDVRIPLPFGYSATPAASIPLYAMTHDRQCDFSIEGVFRDQVWKLLRIQELVDGSWKDIPVTSIRVNEILIGINEDSSRIPVDIYSECRLIGPEEKDYYVKEPTNGNNSMKVRTWYYRSFCPLDNVGGETATLGGSKVTVDLSCRFPVQAVNYVAVNKEIAQYNIYGNYTTHHEFTQGSNPCKTLEINYRQGHPRVSGLTEIDTARRLPLEYAHSMPVEQGYNMFPFCRIHPYDNKIGTAVDLSGLVAIAKIGLGHTCSMYTEQDDRFYSSNNQSPPPRNEEEIGINYKILVRLVVLVRVIVRRLETNKFEVTVRTEVDN